ncbi:hypothetical protein Clacol_003290 [Clathrus columnatus]|uniref:DUF6533 domain-containing protein n=1 Tax=Clathrus columnatus TaxID=1419009 RepID=A0AAV5A772_9AGAM|nr:hypothetical protein Clacol_003290 [Clathrus columnatus]
MSNSNSNQISLQEFAQIYTTEVYDSIVVNHLLYAGLTIMVWDTILTFGEEVDVIWRRNIRNSGRGLFTARAYAISGNRKFVLALLLPLDLARFVNGIVSTTTVIQICRKDNDLPQSLVNSFNVKSPGQSKNLTVLIFEQGVYEFGLMALLVILINILIRVLPGNSRSFGNATPINISIPTLLLARFCLALRHRNAPDIAAAQTRYPSGYTWSSSQAKLLAEFGERSPTSAISTASRFSQSSRGSRRTSISGSRASDDIRLTVYSPVSVLYRHDEEVEDELDEIAEEEGHHDVETPLTVERDRYHD